MAVRALLDVNVLIALAWPNHVHHHAARSWFQEWGAKNGWASCPISEAGFVRVCCNPLAVRQAVTPRDAISMLRQLRQGGCLATLDSRLAQLHPSNAHIAVLLIPV